MKFSEIPYERADLAAWQKSVEELTSKFQAAETFEEADALYCRKDAADMAGDTATTIAMIRRDMDTRDEFYDGEVTYYDEQLPTLEPAFQAWTMAALNSPFRPQLEQKYGAVPFINAEMELKTFQPEIIPDLQKENELTSRYSKLLASAQISFQGEMLTLSQLGPWLSNADDEIRRQAWCAKGDWFNAHGRELDEIYDELVKVRDAMGRKLGYDGFTQLGYYRMERNCYGPGEIEKFRVAVQRYLVPLAKKLYMMQAQRQGREFPLSFADKDLTFRSGNPRPMGEAEQVLAAADKLYSQLSPETAEFWSFMRENEMMDVISRTGKSGGGYCTRLDQYRSPFVFANFNGTAGDVEVVTHEAGHAFEAYLNRDRIPAASIAPGAEACEVHSMAMEFFAWPWAEDFFGEDARKFRYSHLMNALTFIPYGTMVDHFQHVVYEYPEFGPEERHQVWQELLGIYMPWVKPGEIPFYGDGKGWQQQMHIFVMPFYYIDYCLAQTVALDFWARIQEDPKEAFRVYLEYSKRGGTMVFTDLLKESGLGSPFDAGTLQRVCAAAERYLKDYDLSGIE